MKKVMLNKIMNKFVKIIYLFLINIFIFIISFIIFIKLKICNRFLK